MEKLNIEIFIRLKSCCDDLIENPNKEHANNVAKVISDIPNDVMQNLSCYCLFPVVTLLQNNKVSITVREELVRTMRFIIEKIRITKLKQFFQIYGSLLIQIYDKNRTNQVIAFHEELKEEVSLCIKYLVHQSCTDVIEQLYTKENALKLGQAILFCLIIARTEKSPTVRLAAINAIMALCQIDDKIDKSDVVMQEQVADTIMIFLPGIVSGLQEIAMESDVQNHKVTMMALQAWGRVISLVVHDKMEEEEDSILSIEAFIEKCHNLSTDTSHNPNGRKRDIKNNLQGVTRNKEWFKAVAVKLCACINMLDKIRSHSHHKVRRELAKSIGLILKTCPRNVKPNVTALIDHLISLSEDECTEVRETAMNILHSVSEDFMQDHGMRSLVDSLENKFYDFLTLFPTLVRRSDDNEQLAFLNQFTGYLKLLGKQRLSRIMRSQAYIRRLLLALVYIMTIESSNMSLLQTVNVKDLDDPAYFYGLDSWRQFKFIRNSLCKEKLVATCSLLRELGDFRILVDTIFELISDASQHMKELILLLNWIFDSDENMSSVSYLYKEIVDHYITEEVWYLPIEVTENTSLIQARNNIVQCCLLTEGLGRIAEILQRDYDKYLLKTLYLVLERAGSGNSLISYIGVRTLKSIARAQQHKTIGDLLHANVDYFSYHIVIKLRRIRNNPSVLDVMRVVFKYSRLDFLPYLKGIVENVLNQLKIIPYQQKDSYSFLKIFHIFIVYIETLMRQQDTEATKKEDVQAADNSSKVIVLSLLEYHMKKIHEKIEDNYKDTESNADILNTEISEETKEDCFRSNVEDTKDKKLPAHVKIIVDILKSCLNFVPLKDVQKSLLAMETLQKGLPLLIEWEDELLPLVHQLWHPLVDRFKDENALVIHRAWQLLHVLADVSNDFIRSRTLKQIWPPISKFLKESSKESLNKISTDMYKFTQTYKLQYELLSTLGIIAQLLKLYERDLWEILNSTYLYLNARQNVNLQACCIKLYKDIACYHRDIVWVKCLGIWNSKIAPIPADMTLDIKTLLNTDVRPNEYYRNVNTIIKYIQEKDAQC